MLSIKESIIGRKGSGLHRLRDLPLIYDNIFTPGNVVTIEDSDEHVVCDYIALSECPAFAPLIQYFPILMRYDGSRPKGYGYWSNVDDCFRYRFPKHNKYPEVVITNIKGTIPESELRNMRTTEDLKAIFDKYNLVYETH